MDFSNHENGKNLVFLGTFQLLPNFRLLENQNQGKFRKSQQSKFRSTSNNVIYAKKNCLGAQQILQWPFSKYPKYQNIFGILSMFICLLPYILKS